MFDAQQCLLLAGVVVVVRQLTWTLSLSANDEARRRRLSDFISRYEPVYYDRQKILQRTTRSTPDTALPLQFTMHAYGRTFRVRLKRDAGVYSRNITVENATHVISFDSSRAYRGYVEGDGRSAVYGTLAVDGVFDGVVELSDDEYSVERADRYLRHAEFPSVMYRHADISTSRLINSTVCLSDLLHQLHSAQHTAPLRQQSFSASHQQREQRHRHHQWKFTGRYSSPLYADPTKTTCTMYLQADHLFYQKFNSDMDVVIEQLTQHVQAVNDIYTSVDFDEDGVADNINFIIKRIKVWTSASAPGYRFAGNYGVEAFLELLSEDNYDAFCLAYIFTYRDFDGGTLGLAWTGDVNNAGGVCERNGQYRGSVKSLNCGVVTILNYGKDVPPKVSHVTMAHEIGHNIGSQHDPETAECSPGGPDGNYIMYARATSGDRPNNNKFSSCSKKSMSQVLQFKARTHNGCFISSTTAICGNGVVEGDEECDCGWQDECREECCYPQTSASLLSSSSSSAAAAAGRPCTRRPGAKCSPSEGACCTSDCQLISRHVAYVCRQETSCQTTSLCDGSSPMCPASINVADKTRCDEDSVCYQGECSGSVCLMFDLAACQCQPSTSDNFDDAQLCQLCCMRPGNLQSCRPAVEWNELEGFNIPQLTAKPGSPCFNFRGFCDVFHKCREVDPTGPLANLKKLLFSTDNAIVQWLSVYWFIPAACVACLLTLVAMLTISLCGRRRRPDTNVKSTSAPSAAASVTSRHAHLHRRHHLLSTRKVSSVVHYRRTTATTTSVAAAGSDAGRLRQLSADGQLVYVSWL